MTKGSGNGADAGRELRKQLKKFLSAGDAHADFKTATKDVPREKRGLVPPGAAHSLWELAEHVRLAQADILEFAQSASYREKTFPDDYWPPSPVPTDEEWSACLAGFSADLAELKRIADDESVDLAAKVPAGDGQTFLRELLLTIDHNSYHIGQMILTRRIVGAWEGE